MSAFTDIGYYAEDPEDVSHVAVPGSRGTAGTLATPWAPRRSAATDRARAEAMAALRPLLERHRTRIKPRVTPYAERYQQARERVLKGRGW